ncbi:unnamed protein product [Blepharisma stoltei]|uniref:Uncharacterized protein n=1 Tax=Blepharisma stoltei TaxID=1481888 RepID=A0AAU9ICL6_9CILI|nr:unnamed protein product [Blepharisma stoltei]
MLKLPTGSLSRKSSKEFSSREVDQISSELKEEFENTKKFIESDFEISQLRYQNLVASPKESMRLKSILNELINQTHNKQKYLDDLINKSAELKNYFKENDNFEKYEAKIEKIKKKIQKINKKTEQEEENSEFYQNLLEKCQEGLQIYKERIGSMKEMYKEATKNYDSVMMERYKARNDFIAVKNKVSQTISKFHDEKTMFENCYEKMKNKFTEICEENTCEIEKLANLNLKYKEYKATRDSFISSLKEEASGQKENKSLSMKSNSKLFSFQEDVEKIKEVLTRFGIEIKEDLYEMVSHGWYQVISKESTLRMEFEAISEEQRLKEIECNEIKEELNKIKTKNAPAATETPLFHNESEIVEHEQSILFSYYKTIDVLSKFFQIIFNIAINSYLVENDLKTHLSVLIHESKILAKGFPKNLENEFNPEKMGDSIFISQTSEMLIDDYLIYGPISKKKLKELYGKYLNSDTNAFIEVFKSCKPTNLFCSHSMLQEFFKDLKEENPIELFPKLVSQCHQIIKTETAYFLNNSSNLFKMVIKSNNEFSSSNQITPQVTDSNLSSQLPKINKISKPYSNIGNSDYTLINKYRVTERLLRRPTKQQKKDEFIASISTINSLQNSFASNNKAATLSQCKSFEASSFLTNSALSEVKTIESKLRDIKLLEGKAKRHRKNNSLDFEEKSSFIWNGGVRRQNSAGILVSPKAKTSINFLVNKKSLKS